MFKVLIVDDDNLARKGLITVMPWKKCNIEVVGEASNGEKALEFLENNPVDIVITDLEMPFMSGIELMRLIRCKYPNMYIVVLTMHQEFELIQEAMRLGAIDYIVKVQLEKEHLNTVLARIVSRVTEENKKRIENYVSEDNSVLKFSDAYILLLSSNITREDILSRLSKEDDVVEAIDKGKWLYLSKKQVDKELFIKKISILFPSKDRTIINVHGIDQVSIDNLKLLVGNYCRRSLFYTYVPSETYISVHLEDLYNEPPKIEQHRLDSIWDDVMSLNWVNDEINFKNILDAIENLRIPEDVLQYMLFNLIKQWNVQYGEILGFDVRADYKIRCWQYFKIWMEDLREKVHVIITSSEFSYEVTRSIAKALEIMKNESSHALHTLEIATRVNMSRGYFNHCFKKILGVSFHDKLIELRIERAIHYLENTTLPIKDIAQQVGYNDSKHFSRLFLNKIGQLPSQYRIVNKKVDN